MTLAAGTGPAEASTGLALDLGGLEARAARVVRARVLATDVRWDDARRRVITGVELEVLEPLKGQGGSRVRVIQPGGAIDGIEQRVNGAPAWRVGEEVVVFLGTASAGAARVVGLSQGKLRVERDGAVARVVPDAATRTLALVDAKTGRLVASPLAPVTLEQLRVQLAASAADRRTP